MKEAVRLRPVPRSKVADGAVEQLAGEILKGRFKAGERLPPERDLAEMLAISRLGVREALRAIESMGLIQTVPGGGSYVRDVGSSANLNVLDLAVRSGIVTDPDMLSEILDLRLILLRGILPTALERMNEEDHARLLAALADLFEHLDAPAEERPRYDFAFFDRLVAASRSRVLNLLMNTLRPVFLQVTAVLISSLDDEGRGSHRRFYESLMAAIEKRDAAGALAFIESFMKEERALLKKSGAIR